MSRAYVFYILMFLVAAAGLWVILILGRAAAAPDDVSGNWTVEWETTAPPGADPAGQAPSMHVAQSGRYFNVRFGERAPIRMTLESNWTGRRTGRLLKMRLHGQAWTLDLRGDIPPGERFRVPEVRLELAGPTRHVGIARRQREQTVEAASARPDAPPASSSPRPASTRPDIPDAPAAPLATPTAAAPTAAAAIAAAPIAAAAETAHAW
jgi:hypothetical protein